MASDIVVEIRPQGYAVLIMKKEPVNTFSMELWQQLADTFESLEKNPKVRGVIFTSGVKRDVFSAGNDIKELYAPYTSRQQYTKFWVLQNKFLARVYRSPLVTVAAIRGACPAGGCMLSLCCDYRVMTDFGSIGLNEVAIGISVPEMWGQVMVSTIGHGQAEKLLKFAVQLPPSEAKQVGLVDEVVSKEQLMPAAEKVMQKLLKVPDHGRQVTKKLLREEFSKKWEAFPEQEAVGAWAMLEQPTTVAALGAVLQRLSGKPPAAKL